MICSKCGFEAKDGSTFCPECGAPLDAAAVEAGETAAPAPQESAPVLAAGTAAPAQQPAAQEAAPIKPRRQFIPKPGVKYGVNKGARALGIIFTVLLVPTLFMTLLSTVAFLVSGKLEYTQLVYATVGGTNYGFTAAEVQNFLSSGLPLAVFGALSAALILGVIMVNIHQIRYALLDLGIAFIICGIALIFADIIPYSAFLAAAIAEFALYLLTSAGTTLKIVSFAAVAVGVVGIVGFIICNAVKMREAIRFKKLGGKYKLVIIIVWLVLFLAASVYVGVAASGVLGLLA